jgi:hypothetical protein
LEIGERERFLVILLSSGDFKKSKNNLLYGKENQGCIMIQDEALADATFSVEGSNAKGNSVIVRSR